MAGSMRGVNDRPGKQVLYICLIGLALSVAFLNPFKFPIAALASLCCLLCVVMYIRSDRKREQSRQRGFPIAPKREPHENSSDTSTPD